MEHDADPDPGWCRSGGRRALRLLLAGFFAPYVGLPVTAAYVGQLEDPSSTGWKLAASSAAIVAFGIALCAVVPAVFLLQQITTWSFVHRHGYQQEWRDIDWSDRRWHPVHAVIERLIPDPANLRFVQVFSAEGRIRTLHVPRTLGGRLGRLGDFGVRHQRKLMVAGLVSGLAIAAANDLAPGWYDSPAFTVVLVVWLVIGVPLAGRNVVFTWRQNVRAPGQVVLIPRPWSSLARSSPALLAHELTHVRHKDALVRKVLAHYKGFGTALVWLSFGPILVLPIPEPGRWLLVAALFLVRRYAGRRMVPQILLLQEVRADLYGLAAGGGGPAGLIEALARVSPDLDDAAVAPRARAIEQRGLARPDLLRCYRTAAAGLLAGAGAALLVVLYVTHIVTPDVQYLLTP